jgi:hypothetical protein
MTTFPFGPSTSRRNCARHPKSRSTHSLPLSLEIMIARLWTILQEKKVKVC